MGSLPIGTIVHNVELKIGKGGALARSAGNYAQIVGRDQGYVIVRLNSGEQRLISGLCYATVGAVSNPDHMNRNDGKAGRSRWLGRRPHNRGVSMNPVDHPAWRRRRPHLGWPSSGHALGSADQGQEDPLEQADRYVHRVEPSRPQEEELRSVMARSLWKGPFVDGYLLKKAEVARSAARSEVIKIWSRRSTILPQFVGLTFGVYNGHKHVPVNVSEEMVGHKFGEFSPTRTFHGHAADKKAKRK